MVRPIESSESAYLANCAPPSSRLRRVGATVKRYAAIAAAAIAALPAGASAMAQSLALAKAGVAPQGAACETYFLGGMPSIAANSKPIFPLSGAMPDGYELHGLLLSVEVTVKSTAAAFNWGAADMNTLMAQLISRVRLAGWGTEDVVNLTPAELRTLAIYAYGRDVWCADVQGRVGSQIPASGGTAIVVRIPLIIPFTHRSLDTPEQFCPSTDQFNVPGHKLTVEFGGQAGLTTLALASGTGNFVFSSVNVYAMISPAQFVHFGPQQNMRVFQVTQNRYSEDGRGLDLFLADERDPYTLEVQVAQVTITRDGRQSPLAVPPGALAAHYFLSQQPFDFVVGAQGTDNYDISKNSLGGTGAQVTPYSWIAGNRPSEWQYNTIFRRNRQIFQNLASGGSATATLLNWQVRPIDETFRELVKLVGRYQLSVSSVDDLAYRYGPVNADFKGRYLALKGSIQAP